nr:CvpA family protein [uncultured Mucilaginibacter sp.]
MNYIDLLLLLIILFCVYTSIKQGFILSSLALLSWMGSLAIGFVAYRPLASFLHALMPAAGFWLPPLCFMIGVTVGKLILDGLINLLLDRLPKDAHYHRLNRALGVIPGLANGFIWAAMLSGILLLIPFTNSLFKETRDSKLAGKLVEQVSWLDNSLSPVFSEALNRAVSKKHAAVGEEKAVKLPFKVTDATTRPDLEAEMLVLVNNERKQRGLNPLKADPEMAAVARKHSVDMFARSYFSHYTPEGADPFARMRKAHVVFLTAGENLALAQTLSVAHTGLMNSPGHRANILNPAYGRLGIGILDGGIYGLMITQNFRN